MLVLTMEFNLALDLLFEALLFEEGFVHGLYGNVEAYLILGDYQISFSEPQILLKIFLIRAYSRFRNRQYGTGDVVFDYLKRIGELQALISLI